SSCRPPASPRISGPPSPNRSRSPATTSPGSTGPAGDVSEDPGVMAARLRAVGRRVRFEAVPEAIRAWVVGTPAAVARPAGGRQLTVHWGRSGVDGGGDYVGQPVEHAVLGEGPAGRLAVVGRALVGAEVQHVRATGNQAGQLAGLARPELLALRVSDQQRRPDR